MIPKYLKQALPGKYICLVHTCRGIDSAHMGVQTAVVSRHSSRRGGEPTGQILQRALGASGRQVTKVVN